MGFDLNDLERIVSFTEPAIHPGLAYGVVVRKVVSPDHKEYTRVSHPANIRFCRPGRYRECVLAELS